VVFLVSHLLSCCRLCGGVENREWILLEVVGLLMVGACWLCCDGCIWQWSLSGRCWRLSPPD